MLVRQTPRTTKEFELLLACVRSYTDSNASERIRSLARDVINWKSLNDDARIHRVVPILYRQLNTICPDAVPPTVLAQLKRDFDKNASRNVFLSDELLRLLNLFKRGGVHAIAYKGPVLAAVAYLSPSDRQYRDLDIMVAKNDRHNALELMLSAGYRCLANNNDHHFEMMRWCGYDWFGSNFTYVVEVHWRFTANDSPSIDPRIVRQPLHIIQIRDTATNVYNASDTLLITCLHGTRHLWNRLQMMCDVAGIVANHTIEWDRILELAGKSGAQRAVLLGLSLTNETVSLALPEHVMRRIQRDSAIDGLAGCAKTRLIVNAASSRSAPAHDAAGWEDTYREWRFLINSFERRHDRMLRRLMLLWKLIKFAIVPVKMDRELVVIPEPFYFVYYVIRPIRLLFKCTGRMSYYMAIVRGIARER